MAAFETRDSRCFGVEPQPGDSEQRPGSPLSPASRAPQELLWSREEGILLPARQWLRGNVPTIAVLEKQIALQMSPQNLNAYIYLLVVLFQVWRKAEGPQPRSSSHKGLEEGSDVFWDFFFLFSLHSICEMKTQIHKATPPSTVTEEGTNWRTIKSGLCLSCHDISSYLPAAAEFSPIFFFSNSWTLSSLVRTGLSCNFFIILQKLFLHLLKSFHVLLISPSVPISLKHCPQTAGPEGGQATPGWPGNRMYPL